MLPSCHRMRTSAEFATTVRAGQRAGRRTVVVHALRVEPTRDGAAAEPTRVGFVVSKRVGNAVVRNRTRRRLRSLVREHLREVGDGLLIVVRALPAAAAASSAHLDRDLNGALSAASQRARPKPQEGTAAPTRAGAAATGGGTR